MTTHPNTLDRGVPIKDRLWPLNTPLAHLPKDFHRDDVKSIMMLSLRRSHIGKLTAFDEFARSDPVASNTESLLQLFIRSCHHFRNHYNNTKGFGWHNSEYPEKVYLEVVVESDEERGKRIALAARSDNANFGTRHEILRDVLGATREDMERLALVQSGKVDKTLTTFMSEIGDREVVEYRLWVMGCSADGVGHTHDRCMVDMLQQSFDWHVKRILPSSAECNDKERVKRLAQLAASGELKSHILKASASASDSERWTLFESMESYCAFLRTYTRDVNFALPEQMNRCLAANVGLSDPDNPANPKNVFFPGRYFEGDHLNVCVAQRLVQNYTVELPGNKTRWQFPYPTCVIEVPPNFLEVPIFCRKMTPDYQARVVQQRLSRKHFPPIAKLQESQLREKLSATADEYDATMPKTTTTNETINNAFEQANNGYDTPDEDEQMRRLAQAEEDEDNAYANEVDENNVDEIDAMRPVSDEQMMRELMKLQREKEARIKTLIERHGILNLTQLRGWAQKKKKKIGPQGLGNSIHSSNSSSSSSSAILNDGASNGGYSSAAEMASAMLDEIDIPDDLERQCLATFDYGDAASRKQDRQVNDFGTGADLTSLSTMRTHYIHHVLPHRRKIKEPFDLALQYTIDQDAIFNEYALKCSSSSSMISAVGASINAWMEKCAADDDDRLRVKYTIVDDRLSLFATIITQLMLDFDKLWGVYAAHREALTAVLALFNTPHHVYALHICVLLIGEAAVSKSYLIEMIERIGIEGTVKMINGQTAASRNIQGNRDDIMDAYQEMNAGYLVENNRKGMPDKNKEHDQFKERIGTCQVKYEYFVQTPGGPRTSAIAHSSQIGNVLAATNINKSEMAGPSLSRFWVCQMFPMHSANTDLSEVDAGSRAAALLDRHNMANDNAVHDLRIRQARCYMWEKLIASGGLTDVTMSTYNLFLPIFNKTMYDELGIKVPVRTNKRIELLGRTVVIIEADMRAFGLPTSPYYCKRFDVRQGKYLDFWLRDHRELVFWLFGFAIDQCIDVQETKLVTQTRLHFSSRFKDCGLFRKPEEETQTTELNSEKNKRTQFTTNNMKRTDDVDGYQMRKETLDRIDKNIVSVSEDVLGGLNRMMTAQFGSTKKDAHYSGIKTPGGLDIIKPEYQQYYDWNYVRVEMSIDDFSAKLAYAMRKATRPMSASQVKNELFALTKRAITSKRFIQNVKFGAPDEPYPVVVDPTDKEPDKFMAVRSHYHERGRRFYIASALLFTKWTDPAKLVIRRCMDMHTPKGHYLSGAPYREDTPGLFALEELKADPTFVHMFNNTAGLDAPAMKWVGGGSYHKAALKEQKAAKESGRRLPPWLTEEMFVINCDVDQFTTRARLCHIGLPWDNPELIMKFDIRNADDAWRAAAEKSPYPAKYPEDAYKDLVKADRGRRVKEAMAKVALSKLDDADLDGAIINDVSVDIKRKRQEELTAAKRKKDNDDDDDDVDDKRLFVEPSFFATVTGKKNAQVAKGSDFDARKMQKTDLFKKLEERHKEAVENAATREKDMMASAQFINDIVQDKLPAAAPAAETTTASTSTTISQPPQHEQPTPITAKPAVLFQLVWNKKGDDLLRQLHNKPDMAGVTKEDGDFDFGEDRGFALDDDEVVDDTPNTDIYDTEYMAWDYDPVYHRQAAEEREELERLDEYYGIDLESPE
jgi:hypothetical protein